MADYGTDDEIKLQEESKEIMKSMIKSYRAPNDDDIIQKEELWDCLDFIGINVKDENAMRAIRTQFDTDKDGQLSIDEIVNQWELLQTHSLHSDYLLKCFKKLDKNKDGFLRLPELRTILTAKGKNQFSGTEAAVLLEDLMKYDKDNNGKFTYTEFVEMYAENEFPFKPKGLPTKKLPDAKQKMDD
ncbi:unnamed protein product [Owenia fusiformis]|uniref:Uncharacterized protein n=1 Tax=Owenia fusiformis TaxID=6347 RepID=A0A8J1XY51_OWEFU|nr:unnamed protein product [Owenia fusiformis]